MLPVFGDLDTERGIQLIWESEIAIADLIQEEDFPAEAILACDPGLLEGDAEVICMVTMCGPTFESPYPFLNHPDPIWPNDFDTDIFELTHEEQAEYDCFFPLSRIKDCDGFGLLYILRSIDGSFRWHLGNL